MPARMAQALNWFINLFLSEGRLHEANEYFQELTFLSDKNKMEFIQHLFKYNKAKILKKSKRGRDQYKAQEILSELLKDTSRGFDFSVAYDLCKSLLQELDHFESDEVLAEVSDLINEVYERAQDQQLIVWIIQALPLKAKLELITESNYALSEKLLEQALVIAEERGLIGLKTTIEGEQKKLETDFDKWEEMLLSGSTIRERIKQSRIQEYLDDVLSKQIKV